VNSRAVPFSIFSHFSDLGAKLVPAKSKAPEALLNSLSAERQYSLSNNIGWSCWSEKTCINDLMRQFPVSLCDYCNQ